MVSFLKRIPLWVWLSFFALLALLQVFLVRDVVMGDAFIHFVFARGISENQPFFYNGEFSAGSTSPLWSVLLATLFKFMGNEIVWGVKVFASFFVVLSIFSTFSLAYKISKNKVISLLTSFLLATSFVFSFWAAKGMETPLYVSLVLGSFLFYLRILEEKHSLAWEIFLGIFLGLGILARPEAWFLSLFLGIPLLIKKGWRVILTIGLPAFLIFSPYYLWLYENTHQFFPSSIARILRAQQWSYEFHGIYFTLEVVKILLTKFLFLTPLSAFFVWKEKFTHPKRYIFYPIFAWLGFHLIFFSLVFPTTEGYRYILATLPFFFLLTLLGVWKVKKKKIRNLILALILLSSIAISTQQLFERMDSITSCEKPFIDKTRREVGLWIRENTREDDVIAMKEIDQSAFYGERRMLSMDATLDTKAIPFVESGKQLEFILQEKPNYFILEEEMYREYPSWENSNILPLIDSHPQVGETQTLDGVDFTLLEKFKVGDEKACKHFSQEYFWWIFRVNY